jgi:hypothetical protein
MATNGLFRSALRISALTAMALLTLAGAARAQDVVQSGEAPVAKPVAKPLPVLGLGLDVGVPDGAAVSGVYRPFRWLRAEVGGSYNMISKGVRGGLTLVPFGMGPSATLEAGHYFDGDANGLARKFAGAGFDDNAVLQRIGYDYANAHLGLDFGMRRVVFFIHGGMSYIRANVHNINSELPGGTASAGGMGSSGGTTVSFNQDPTVRIFTPSVKLGFIFYIW